MEQNLIYILPAFGILGLVYMFFLSSWVKKQPEGSDKMKKLSGYIADGALAFLKAEYKMLAVFVIIAGAALGVLAATEMIHAGLFIVVAFVIGAVFSAVAGNIGMRIATKANVRTAEAAKTSLPQAMKVAFRGGTVMGLGVAGLAVFGLSTIFIFLVMNVGGTGEALKGENMLIILETLAGFSLGAECIALFARVGGGIYTKAADVGADLVGKVEAGIPEDDIRNPATIADNVGDNVGDVAGMGADLFGSYVATMLAAMVLGNYLIGQNAEDVFTKFDGMGPILMPVLIAGVGILFSIFGSWVIKIKNNDAKEKQVQGAFNLGNWGSLALTAVASFFIIKWMLPAKMNMEFFGADDQMVGYNRVFYAVLIGLAVGGLISMLTEYYTAMGKKPVMGIIKNSSTGAATNIISGLSLGMMSTAAPIILFAGAIWGAYACAGFYGVAIGASAMMATTALQLAIDAFGPIADNAGGIAEMSELDPEVRERTDILDAVGNTTAAVGKGFAIASAALTALALFAAFVTFTGIDGINIFKADVLAALFVGAMIPVVFSALAMSAVGKAAMAMVKEVRRQFKDIPGIMEYKAEPEYDKCVDISTKAALKEMMLPGLITIVSPIIIGFAMGAEALGAYMAGVTVSGVLWAIFQNNAGGAWDNAKKSFEAGVMIDGEMSYKGSEAHKAAVTGDTVGDPFKDTSGPSMNILIKLTCLIGLVIAPMLAVGDSNEDGGETVCSGENKECCAKKKSCDSGAKACKGDWDPKKCHMEGMKCDLSKCSEMTKEECRANCEKERCSAEAIEMCMSMYNEAGEFVGHDDKKCCKDKASCEDHLDNHGGEGHAH
ncbi:sodium-translocating pyrophosphatase [Crocinitomicaceae bacterium]|nr:sodium-translocating pyrophosphatase [Crocinitomicaceae bacterium]MDC0099300.1 sodium-translocating pyrophosphatase [Crocinitomicaceae bacterium]MDC1196003.1 sodium-translocating pyrophosphatase [Crocinitomicaceae bacterium]